MYENQNLNQEIQAEVPNENFDTTEVFESELADTQNSCEGQSIDPSHLILGKFKSTEDLSKAYQELQKLQGNQTQELGALRQQASMLHMITDAWEKERSIKLSEQELKNAASKYNTPEYFQDPSFRQMYREAYMALGNNLDVDKFINLIEGYVSARVFAHDQKKAANAETQKAIEGMIFDKNSQTSFNPPKKLIAEMTPKELDELLDRLI